MIINRSTGCLAFATSVDGYSTSHQTISTDMELKIKEELKKFIDSFPNEDLNFFLEYLVDRFGDVTHDDDEPCECCGDYVTEYEWRINE